MARSAPKVDVSLSVARKLEQSLLVRQKGKEKVNETCLGFIGRRQSADIEVSLEGKRCYTFAAAAGPGSVDISLSLRIDDVEVAADRLSGQWPAVNWCAPSDGAAVVRLSTYEGEGTYVLLMLEDRIEQRAKSHKVGGDGKDFVANRIRQLHCQFAAGKAPVSALFQGNLAAGESLTNAIHLKRGRCYVVLGAGCPSVKDLKIVLRDKGGNTVAEDRTENSFPVIDSGICPSTDQDLVLQVTLAAGSGPFGVQVFSD